MATNALPAGYALQEYRIEKVLGVGGFGLTYLALDGNLNLKVAVKEYLPDDVATRGADHSISPRSPDNAEHFGWGKQRFLDESRVVVKHAAVKARDEAELYLLLAAEIEDAEERKAFSRAGLPAPRRH